MKKTITILFLLSIAKNISSCQKGKDTKIAKKDKYDFMASSCAPMAYPAIVVNGDFYLADGSSLYIPAGGRILEAGWHDDGAGHVTGPEFKALPTELKVTWLSIAEKKFYTGRFKLDYDLILKYFKKGYTYHRANKHKTFLSIIAGLAPGGVVVVWIDGYDIRIEIGRFKAKETEVTMKDFVPTTTTPKKEYLDGKFNRLIINEVKKEVAAGKIPYGLWDTYRKKYTWQPKAFFANGGKATLMYIKYFNGEISTNTDDAGAIGYKEKAIPKYISFGWEDKNGYKFAADIRFAQKYRKTDDYTKFKEVEKEIFEAFKKLNTSENKQLDLLFKIDKYNSNIQLFLKNDTEEIELKKTFIKIYENN